MVDWSDANEIARESQVFERLIFCTLGVVLWEIFTTCDFEWSLVRGRRKFRYPLVFFFFFSRYCILLAIVGLIVSISATTRINCGALYVFNSWAGNMTLLCSSTSLMLRTIALWERKRTVVIPLGVLCLAFWAILYRTMFIVQASWSDTQETCVVTSTSPGLLNVTFFFTMAFDFTILVYTFIALITKHTARTDLWKLLFQDGLVYFVVTFTANCIPAVFNVLNLNLLMNVIATIPAAAITSIASCRAVMRLFEFTSNEVYVHSGMAQSGSGPHITRNPRISAAPQFAMARPEVIVTTEHITMSEFPSDSDSPYTVKSSRSSITGDVVEDHKGYGENARESLESTAV